MPTIRTRHPIIRFIIDLFRGGPNPFLASPIAAAIDREADIEKNAKAASRSGTNEVGDAEKLTHDVHIKIDKCLAVSYSTTDGLLDGLNDEVGDVENKLENARPSKLKGDMEHALRKIIGRTDEEFRPAANDLHRKEADLQRFLSDHDLENTRKKHWGTKITRGGVYFIAAITVAEFILNSAFFAGTQRTGLIGGAALAALLSIVTIALGMAFGLAYQFSDSRADGNGWRGRIGMAVLSLVMLFYLLMLTLARHFGELGDPNLYETVAREIQSRPFSGLLDLPAFAYFVFSVFVICLVAWKYVAIMGHFPRIRNLNLAVSEAEKELADIRLDLVDELEDEVDVHRDGVDALPEKIQAYKMELEGILADHENIVDQFKFDLEEIKDASKLLISVIRKYIRAPDECFELGIDFNPVARKVEKRQAEFAKRVEMLLRRPEVSQTAIDKCKDEMTAIGKRERRALEGKCDKISDNHPPRSHNVPSPGPPPEEGNIAWLRSR